MYAILVLDNGIASILRCVECINDGKAFDGLLLNHCAVVLASEVSRKYTNLTLMYGNGILFTVFRYTLRHNER